MSTANEPIALSACNAQLATLANVSTPDSKAFRTSPLLLHSFGFAVPLNASIDGILVHIMRAHSTFQAEDAVVELVVGTAARSDNEEVNTAWSDQLSLRQYTFGTDRLSAADVNSDSFGVRLVVESTGTGGRSSGFARVNCVLASVQYTPGGTTTTGRRTSLVGLSRPETPAPTQQATAETKPVVGSTTVIQLVSDTSLTLMLENATAADVPNGAGLVVGATVGGVVAFLLIGGGVGFFLWRYNHRSHVRAASPPVTLPQPQVAAVPSRQQYASTSAEFRPEDRAQYDQFTPVEADAGHYATTVDEFKPKDDRPQYGRL